MMRKQTGVRFSTETNAEKGGEWRTGVLIDGWEGYRDLPWEFVNKKPRPLNFGHEYGNEIKRNGVAILMVWESL